MQPTLAYDVYGTLIDTHGLVVTLHQLVGEQAMAFSQLWREKQLEYSFRRGLMQHYVTFAVCTAEALDYTCRRFKVALAETQKEQLLRGYHTLPAFEEVKPSLVRAKELGLRLFAFSNGSRDALEMLLGSAGIRELFLDLVSVDEVKSFKPNPGVYCHFLRRTGASGRAAWLISSNPFDVIGAISAGMKAAWVKRAEDAVFDPWGIEPTLTVSNLSGLAEAILAAELVA